MSNPQRTGRGERPVLAPLAMVVLLCSGLAAVLLLHLPEEDRPSVEERLRSPTVGGEDLDYAEEADCN